MTAKIDSNLLIPFPGPFLIVGMGKSGLAAQRLLLLAGVPKEDIFTFDDKATADFQNGTDALQSAKPGTLIVSPGYPLTTEWIQKAKKSGLQITSELSLATFFLTTEFLIGVTGSVGKSTVSALMGFAFEGLQEQALVCGNFGIPLADYAADILEKKTLQRKRYLVIELSSYQLENCDGLKLNCSALVSLTPNHLERYKTQFHYYTTKLQIFNITSGEKFCACESAGLFSFFEELAQGKHQDVFKEFGYSNLNFLKHIRIAGSSEHLVNLEKKYSSDNSCYFDLERSFQLNLPEAKQHRLIGHHNKMNILLCMALFRSLGFKDTADTYLKNYGGLPHRLENLGEKSGVTFINDSKATTLESVITAAHTLEQFYPKRRAFLLVGGKDKNLPWHELGQLRKTLELNFIFFGACGALAREKSQLKGHLTPTLATGLNDLKTLLKVGDVVLLSPGGTSLDEFKNFEDRGLFFKSWVNQFNL